MKQATAIIPARYESRRFPGKALAQIRGKPMIQCVYEKTKKAKHLERVIIATDDERIMEACRTFHAEAFMSSIHHRSGTERVAEIAEKIDSPLIINVQGDEPLLRGEMIDALVLAMQDTNIPMTTLVNKVTDLSLFNERNTVKVVIDKNGFALYFSRSAVPHQASDFFWQHIGVYGFQRDFLIKFCKLPRSRLEEMESLEQLRALENGFKIKVIETKYQTLSVDTPQDIIKIENFLNARIND